MTAEQALTDLAITPAMMSRDIWRTLREREDEAHRQHRAAEGGEDHAGRADHAAARVHKSLKPSSFGVKKRG